jgi:hypothetical protein
MKLTNSEQFMQNARHDLFLSQNGHLQVGWRSSEGSYLRMALMPGSSLPSMYSSIAPPPVET